MALMDILQSLLQPGQMTNAMAPGQANGPGAQANFPLSELLAQSTQREQPTQQASVAPVTVSPPASSAVSAPSADVAAAQAAPSAQGVSSGDTQLMGGVPGDPTFDTGAAQTGQPPRLDYNNSQSVKAVNNAVNSDIATSPNTNPGLYGVLPKGLQHGTLRNVLGALGDALMVSGGKAPTYADQLARQTAGNALAGMDISNPQSVAAAVQRLAATGVPGAADMADKIQQQAQQAALQKQIQEQNFQYRSGVLEDRKNYHDQETATRNAGRYQQMFPAFTADMSSAQSDDDYRAKLSAWNQRIKMVDPDADATSAFGAPLNYTPGFYTPYSGMSNTQIGQHEDKVRGQNMTQENSQGRDAAIAGSAQTHASAQRYSADRSATRPTQQIEDQQYIAMKKAGIPTTAEQDQNFQSHNQISSRSRRPTPSASAPRPITAEDVQALRANPQYAEQFNARFKQFGPNVAQRILGSQPGQLH